MAITFPDNAYEDTCLYCGGHVGYGVPQFHIGVCDKRECHEVSGMQAQIDLEAAGDTTTTDIRFMRHVERLAARHKQHAKH